MWTYIYFALFFGTFVALLVVLNAFTKKVSELERQRAEIEVEEDRVFDFLHGLGEAFSEGVQSSELHRLIVESAVRILDAHGGALYLADKNDSTLSPAFISKGCPPMVDVPRHILEQAVVTSVALESYLRLHPVRKGEGIIGECWESGQPRVIEASEYTDTQGGATSALVGPLVYRRKILGVLGLANGPMSTSFGVADLKVFKAIAEQGAFALYNEVVYLEAGEKKRMDHDLEIAREIQGILLPSSRAGRWRSEPTFPPGSWLREAPGGDAPRYPTANNGSPRRYPRLPGERKLGNLARPDRTMPASIRPSPWRAGCRPATTAAHLTRTASPGLPRSCSRMHSWATRRPKTCTNRKLLLCARPCSTPSGGSPRRRFPSW